MAGLMKLACLVLACMIVAGPITSKAALSCGTVNTNVAACIGYLTVGALPRACCTGVSKLNSIARTTPDRQQACRCLKTAASALGSGLNAGRAAGLPKACGVNVPFPISLLTRCINCNSVK
uniref:Non-specific lipid-transfer protein n=1 Tax=Brassica oleracea TaxID=3712 RepID=Q39382_BRAOL|nr:lipid transfer protein [Brassica oleracea var. italica]